MWRDGVLLYILDPRLHLPTFLSLAKHRAPLVRRVRAQDDLSATAAEPCSLQPKFRIILLIDTDLNNNYKRLRRRTSH